MTQRKKFSTLSILWLLLASTFVFILADQSDHATAFQDTGEYAMTVIGQPDFVSANATATQSGLQNPYKVTFDSSGDLWVADEVNHRVLEFKPPFTDGMNASLVIGQANFTTNAILTTQSGTSEDAGVTFDSQGNLWVADWINNRVLEFKPPFGDGMNASLELGQDAGPQEFTSSQAYAHLPGQFVNPHLANNLAAPVEVAFDSSGDLWVSDRANNRVLEFKPPFTDGMNASLVIGQSNLTAYVYSVTPTASSLFGPQGLAFDSQGNLWVSDQNDNRILEFGASSLTSDDPKAILELGQPPGTSEFSNHTATDTPNGLYSPSVIAFDSSGDLWVVDHGNNRVLEFKPPFTYGMSASLEIGQPSGPTAFTTSFSATSQDGFDNPLGIAFDPQGNLWVADQNNNRVLEFSGAALKTAGTTISIVNATEENAGNASQVQGSCNQVGTQKLCHLSIDQTADTGLKTDATGAPSGLTADVYSSYLGTQEPSDLGAPPFQTSSAYYGLSVAGLVDGTAAVCVAQQQSATGVAYYSNGSWASPTGVSKSGSSICGTVPLSAMADGQVVLAVEAPGQSGPNSRVGSELASIIEIGEVSALLGGVAVITIVLVARRRRRRLGEAEQDDYDEGLDEWA